MSVTLSLSGMKKQWTVAMCSRFLHINASTGIVRIERIAVLATEQATTGFKTVLLRSKRLGVSHRDLLLLLHFLNNGLCASGRFGSRRVLELLLHLLQTLEMALASLVLVK